MRLKFTLLLIFLQVMLVFSQNQTQGFTENKGQVADQFGKPNPSVKYLLQTNGLNVQLRDGGFSYDVYEACEHTLDKGQKKPSLTGLKQENPDAASPYTYHRIDINFLQSNKDATLLPEGKSADYDNYYNVAHAAKGVTQVYKFQRVTYKNIYKAIDVVFFIPEDQAKPVEYHFIIHPGGNIDDIRLEFNGARTRLADRKINMNLKFGQLQETLPLSWMESDSDKTIVPITYKKISKNVYGFGSAVNISNKKVVIDPVPIRLWGTYFHRYVVTNDAMKILTDQNDNVFLSGDSSQNTNIATSGAFVSTVNLRDANSFHTKFNANGQRLWTTYVANGPNAAYVKDFVVNTAGESYLAGLTFGGQVATLSNDLATPGCHKPVCSFLANDAFILKLDPNGQRIWGTFYGGSERDVINTIALDASENLILAGKTNSPDQIITPGAFQVAYPHSSTFYEAGFFCKFSPAGVQLYGSYFEKEIYKSAVDNSNNVYFGGQFSEWDSYPSIATTGAHQTHCYGTDIFLIKFDAGFTRQWCTYYGGNEMTSSFNNSDRCAAIEIDRNNDIYLIGTSSSPDNIATPGAFKTVLPTGRVNGFVAKFDGSGARIWGTYYGSDDSLTDETCESGSINKMTGAIYLMGNTRSTNYFGSPASFQPVNRGSDECYIAKLDGSGFPLWSTFYGTPSQDFSETIFYKNNKIYCGGFSTGVATLGNNLGTPGTYMPNGGGYLYFIAKLQDCVSSPQVSGNSPVCTGSDIELTATGGTGYLWSGPNGFSSTLSNPKILSASAIHAGQYSCVVTGTGGCDGTSIVNIVVGDPLKPVPNVNPLPRITGDCTMTFTTPTATDQCAGTITATTADPLAYSLPGNYTIHWIYNDGNGNIENQDQAVTISAVALPTTISPQTFCTPQNATLASVVISGLNIRWYDAATSGTMLASSTPLVDGTVYYASQTVNSCESLRVPVSVHIQNTAPPMGNPDQAFCSLQNPTVSLIVANGTGLVWYDGATSATMIPDTAALIDGKTYYATQTISGCESVGRLAVTIHLVRSLSASNYAEFVCDDGNDGFENVNLARFENQLIASPSNFTFAYYQSGPGAMNQIASQLIGDPSACRLSLGAQTIYVRIASANGCYQVVTLALTLVGIPIIDFPDIVPICAGKDVVLDAGPGFDSYTWSTASLSQMATIREPGMYSLTLTKVHGTTVCTTVKSFEVVLSETASITSITTIDGTDTENTITIHINGNGDYAYSVDGKHYQDSPVFEGLTAGNYMVYVRDKNGCGTVKKQVFLLTYPKFFTPNGDGINDRWNIEFSDREPGLTVTVFDRYGKLLKQLGHFNGWDGKFNGKDLPAEDYWFVVERPGQPVYHGHFTLKR